MPGALLRLQFICVKYNIKIHDSEDNCRRTLMDVISIHLILAGPACLKVPVIAGNQPKFLYSGVCKSVFLCCDLQASR